MDMKRYAEAEPLLLDGRARCSIASSGETIRASSRRGGGWPGCTAPSTGPIAPRRTNTRETALSRVHPHAGPV